VALETDRTPAGSAQAKVWRERAAKYRAVARASFDAKSKEALLKLAEDCERYAAKSEGQPGPG
jgi:hypothetical protein